MNVVFVQGLGGGGVAGTAGAGLLLRRPTSERIWNERLP